MSINNDKPQAPSPPLPPVDPPPLDTVANNATSKAELAAFNPELLDHNVRRVGAYGALIVALALYLLGAVVVLKQMSLGPWDCRDIMDLTPDAFHAENCKAPSPSMGDDWHAFVAAMVGLFSVPTVLVIAVLRCVATRKDSAADSVYSLLGERLIAALESWSSIRPKG